MGRYTYFENGKWRIKVGDTEFAGPWVDKLSYYEELAPNLENTKDEAYNLGYQTCLHAKGLTWSEARELQAYRATGLTVERAAELGKADREGRVVMLPCKIGDTVWFTTVCHGVQPLRIKKIQMYIVVKEEHEYGELPVWDLGKTVFLTREEAEKALEDGGNENL